MPTATGLLSSLLDAFVDGLEPLFRRFASRARLVVVEEASSYHLYSGSGRGLTDLGTIPADTPLPRRLKRLASHRVELRLSPARLLTRTLNLPAAGRDYLDAIIEHRLDRLTPWRPDRIVYGHAAAAETAADGSIAVEFAAASTDTVDGSVSRLSALGLRPTAIGSAAEPLDQPLRLDLWSGRADRSRQRLRRATGFTLILLFLLLLPAAAVTSWLAAQSLDRADRMTARLETKREVLRRAAGAGKAEGRDLELMAAKTDDRSVVLLIDRLARLIPDDSYLRELGLEGDKLHLAGTSANAPSLIALLEADPQLSGVRFSAPVTRTENGRDSFDILATVDHQPSPAETGGGT